MAPAHAGQPEGEQAPLDNEVRQKSQAEQLRPLHRPCSLLRSSVNLQFDIANALLRLAAHLPACTPSQSYSYWWETQRDQSVGQGASSR